MANMLEELFNLLEPDKSEENRGTIVIKGDLYAKLNVDANLIVMGDIKAKVNATGDVKRFGGLDPLSGTVISSTDAKRFGGIDPLSGKDISNTEDETVYDIIVRNGTLTIGNSLYKANYNHFYTKGSIVNETNTVTKINCDIEAYAGYGDTAAIINNGPMFYITGRHTVSAINPREQNGCGVTNYDGWFYIDRKSTLRTSGYYTGFKNTGHGSLGVLGKVFSYGGDIGLHNTSLISIIYPGKLYVNGKNIGIYNYNTGSIVTSGLESIVSSSSEESLYNIGGNVTVNFDSSIVAFGGVFNSHLPNADETTKKFVGIHLNGGGAIYAYSVLETDAVHNRGLIDGSGEIYSNGDIYYRELKYQTIPRFEDIEDETDMMLENDNSTASDDDIFIKHNAYDDEAADVVTDEEDTDETPDMGIAVTDEEDPDSEDLDMSITLPEGVDPSEVRVSIGDNEYVVDPDSYSIKKVIKKDDDVESEVDENKEESEEKESIGNRSVYLLSGDIDLIDRSKASNYPRKDDTL